MNEYLIRLALVIKTSHSKFVEKFNKHYCVCDIFSEFGRKRSKN